MKGTEAAGRPRSIGFGKEDPNTNARENSDRTPSAYEKNRSD